MKKTLIALLSILLIAFAFTACDNGNKGPEITEEDQKAADELAKEYMNSINYGELIVQAFNGENTSTLTLSEKSKDGFRIEFTDYKGSALQKATDSEIASIASGAIDFTFSKTTATTTSAKATVAGYDTYTATTVEEKPLKFEKADGTAVGGDFAFTISGEASISFETTGTGTTEEIEKLTEGTKIDIKVPDTATLKVGEVEVSYDTIKEDVTVSGGSEVKDPFTVDEAKTALAAIIDSISKENLKKDLINGLDRVITGKGTNVVGVKFGDFTGKYQDAELDKNALVELLNVIKNPDSASSATNETVKEIAQAITNQKFNILDLQLTIEASFVQEDGQYYTSGLHTGPGAGQTGAVSNVESINAGNIKVTLYPSSFEMTSKTMSGLYSLDATGVIFAMKSTSADASYTVTASKLTAPFSLTIGDSFSGDASLPAENADIDIKVSNGVDSPSVKWTDLKLDGGTGYAKEDAILADAKSFYAHFGTNGFLNDLYQEFSNGENKGSNGIEITTQDTIEVTTTEEPATSSFTMELNLTDYGYWTASSTQRATGEVSATFYGSISEGGDSKTFTATSVDIKSTGAINLTDAADVRHDAKVSLDLKGLKIGTAEGAGIVFKVTTASDESAKNTITGITDYSVKNAYDDTKHEIMFDAKNITIELN